MSIGLRVCRVEGLWCLGLPGCRAWVKGLQGLVLMGLRASSFSGF